MEGGEGGVGEDVCAIVGGWGVVYTHAYRPSGACLGLF